MAKNLTARNTENDLRTAYLLAFDNFSTDPIEVGNAVNGNSRYGRELLGTLVQGGIVCDTLVNGTDQVWQACQTYDSISRDEAIRIFEQWLDSQAPEAPKAKAVATNLVGCKCGCGELANKGRTYRPGHDARHAGQVGRLMAEAFKVNNPELAEGLLLTLPTAALRFKAKGVALKAAQGKGKARKATKAAAAPVSEQGSVKVGRWTYDATRTGDVVTFTNAKGEAKEANAKQAASFQAR